MEACEIALLTAQGYRSSLHVGVKNINLMFGIFICVNCLSTPIVLYIWESKKRQHMMGRLVCVLTDGVLDFIWATAFHGVVLLHGVVTTDIDYDYEEATADVMLKSQVLIVSFANLVFSIFPLLMALIGMMRLRGALSKAQVLSCGVRPSVPLVNSEPQAVAISLAIAKPSLTLVAQAYGHVTKSIIPKLHTAMAIYGVVVLMLSLNSVGLFSSPALDRRCFGVIFPWGRGPTCADIFVNCTDLNIIGQRHEIEMELRSFVPSLLHEIYFADCNELEIPSNIGPFTSLSTLSMSNATIYDWPDAVALVDLAPQLSQLQLTDILILCKPDALMKLPQPVTSIWFERVEAPTELLDVAVADWTSLADFVYMSCNLTRVHPVLFEMVNVDAIALDNNAITSYPERGIGQKATTTALQLTGNPINALPDSLWLHLPALSFLDISFTNISSMPRLEPTNGRNSPMVNAEATPLCDDDEVGDLDWPTVVCDSSD